MRAAAGGRDHAASRAASGQAGRSCREGVPFPACRAPSNAGLSAQNLACMLDIAPEGLRSWQIKSNRMIPLLRNIFVGAGRGIVPGRCRRAHRKAAGSGARGAEAPGLLLYPSDISAWAHLFQLSFNLSLCSPAIQVAQKVTLREKKEKILLKEASRTALGICLSRAYVMHILSTIGCTATIDNHRS